MGNLEIANAGPRLARAPGARSAGEAGAGRLSLRVRWMGRLPYAEGVRLQEQIVRDRRQGLVPDTLLLLEHPPVITAGRGARSEHILIGAAERERRGIEIHQAGRGGDVTYHGPGQLVGYPVMGLRKERRDAHRYLRDLEETLILTAGDCGVRARRSAGLTGIWVDDRKLAAIGVRISTGWITSHGFALNVNTDLSAFRSIVPCGIRGRGVTSLAELTGRQHGLRRVAALAAIRLAEVFDLRPETAGGAEEVLS